ncbi:MAG: hypothetical protein PUI48_06395 [Oscillospiraceae bacterium]|nr:hypothetical protein [Oscillospiraceae bacterium]MDY6208402.1 hypothetical protein [Oscillospiraceae bacterium]
MNRITIKCPKCCNCFEADPDSDTFFCSCCGCGYRILREDQSDPAHPQKIRIMMLEQEEKKKAPISIGNKGALLIVLIAFIIWIFIFLILNS